MAGAKETPRQKLISLMYLVFITMLALNVSKEVLDGFGQMFVKKIEAQTSVIQESKIYFIENIAVNAMKKEGSGSVTKELLKKSKKNLMHFLMK